MDDFEKFVRMYAELYHENKTKEYKVAQLEQEILDLKWEFNDFKLNQLIIRDEDDKTKDKIEY